MPEDPNQQIDPTMGMTPDMSAATPMAPTAQPNDVSSIARLFSLDPATQAELRKTQEDKFRELMNRYYYGMPEGQVGGPNKKQKALGVLKTLLSIGIGQEPPQARLRKVAEEEYNGDTNRLNSNIRDQQVNQALAASAWKAQNEQDKIKAMRERDTATAAYHDVLGQAKTDREASRQRELDIQEDFKKVMGIVAMKNATARDKAIEVSKLKIPFFQAQALNSMDPAEKDAVTRELATLGAIQGIPHMMGTSIGSVRGSSSYDDATGTHTTSTMQKQFRGDPMGIVQRLFGGQGETPVTPPQANPAPAQAPVAAPVQPQAVAPRPVTSPTTVAAAGPGGRQMATEADIMDLLNTPNARLDQNKIYPRGTNTRLLKAASERQEEIRKLQDAGMNYGMLTSALIDAGQRGLDFRGLQGLPIFQKIREFAGDVSSPESFDRFLQNYGTMRQLQGITSRFSTKEYTNTLSAGGAQPHVNLANAAKFAVGHQLRNEAEIAIRRGDLKPEDAPKVYRAIADEQDRIGNAIKQYSDAKGSKEKLQALLNKGQLEVRHLSDIMSARSDAGKALRSGARPAGTVLMSSPDGKQQMAVPANQVEHYKARGAKVIE